MYRWSSVLVLFLFFSSCKDREEQTSYIPSQDVVYGMEIATNGAQMAHIVNRYFFYGFPINTSAHIVHVSGDTNQLPTEENPWIYQFQYDSTSGVDVDGNFKSGVLHFYIYGNIDEEEGKIQVVYNDLTMDNFSSEATITVEYDERSDVYKMDGNEIQIFANDSSSMVDVSSNFTYFPNKELYRFYVKGEGVNRRDRSYKFKSYDSLNRTNNCGSITKGELRIVPKRLSPRNLFYDNNGESCDGQAKVVYRRNSLTFSHP